MSTLESEDAAVALASDPEFPEGIAFNPLPDWPPDDLNSPLQSLLDDLFSDSGANPSSSLTNRGDWEQLLADALHQIFSQRSESLAQLWVPVLRNSRLMLTTQDQPYAVQPYRTDLVRYRDLSARYVFPAGLAGGVSQGLYPGLPGRVFARRVPEWSPNVQQHECTEFLRVRDAARCNVRGTLAVPVVEPCSRQCLAVLELATNAEKLDYEAELVLISRALQAVNLSSKDDGNPEVLQELNGKLVGMMCDVNAAGSLVSHSALSSKVPLSRVRGEAVFPELYQVLQAVCESHGLPMAQTWLPSFHHTSGSIALVTRNAPFYLRDWSFRGFRQACSEQQLEIGQGVAGQAFTTNQPSFKVNVQSFTKEEYPLLHYARCFKVRAAVAIRLRSSLAGSDDFVVEFILPPDSDEPSALLRLISGTMQRVCRTLRTISKQELVMEQGSASSSRVLEFREEETSSIVVNSGAQEQEFRAKRKKLSHDEQPEASEGKKGSEKKRASNEKTVALEVLQQHFAGSLRDAAKSIGVCPTTLKRICRQYGISRWPSRKINKVNRSLMKLQGVIESVEGVDRKVKLDSLTGELASTAAATAALTSKRHSREDQPLPPADSLPVEGVNVYHEREEGAAAEVPVINKGWENFNIKIEPRVHGSSEALTLLEGCQPFELPVEATVERKVSPCIDWTALRPGALSNDASLNCFKAQLLTIKATMGSDTVRFKLSPGFGFETLKDEVATRLRLEPDSFSLKYMDDDSEWVVLNGDGDLEECIDVMESSRSRIIKLVVHVKGAGSISSPSFCSVNS